MPFPSMRDWNWWHWYVVNQDWTHSGSWRWSQIYTEMNSSLKIVLDSARCQTIQCQLQQHLCCQMIKSSGQLSEVAEHRSLVPVQVSGADHHWSVGKAPENKHQPHCSLRNVFINQNSSFGDSRHRPTVLFIGNVKGRAEDRCSAQVSVRVLKSVEESFDECDLESW